METIEDRKKHLLTVGRFIDGKPYLWNELSLAVEGKYTNLRIFIGNEKSISDGCGRQMIYMRLDKYQQYSVPLSKAHYLEKKHEAIEKLLEFYQFGDIDISRLDEVLEITKDMKQRYCLPW